MKTILDRFKNYGTWISLIAAIALVFQVYGLFPKLGLTNETFNQIANVLLAFLVAAGIINNPTSGTGYLDEKKEDVYGIPHTMQDLPMPAVNPPKIVQDKVEVYTDLLGQLDQIKQTVQAELNKPVAPAPQPALTPEQIQNITSGIAQVITQAVGQNGQV